MSQTKYCKRCDRTLPIEQFCKNKQTKDGYGFYCKECMAEYEKRYSAMPKGIYMNLKNYQKWRHKKLVIITKEAFIEWYNDEPKICHYCDIPEGLLEKLIDTQNNKVSRLTIDCKDNGAGYKLGNIVLACNRCNSIKNDFFIYEEMLYIGQTLVKPRWEKQLGYKL